MYNTQIEKSLNQKMKPRYLEPIIVVSRTRRGAYILCELDGSVLHNPVVQFWVIPYLARKNIFLPEGFIDIDSKWLKEMEEQEMAEGEEEFGETYEEEFEEDDTEEMD